MIQFLHADVAGNRRIGLPRTSAYRMPISINDGAVADIMAKFIITDSVCSDYITLVFYSPGSQ